MSQNLPQPQPWPSPPATMTLVNPLTLLNSHLNTFKKWRDKLRPIKDDIKSITEGFIHAHPFLDPLLQPQAPLPDYFKSINAKLHASRRRQRALADEIKLLVLAMRCNAHFFGLELSFNLQNEIIWILHDLESWWFKTNNLHDELETLCGVPRDRLWVQLMSKLPIRVWDVRITPEQPSSLAAGAWHPGQPHPKL